MTLLRIWLYAGNYVFRTSLTIYVILLSIFFYKKKIDADRTLLNINSQNRDVSVTLKTCTNIQSAENCKEFSETIRQISNNNNGENMSFFKWFAGVVDGDGNFDLRNINNKLVLKAIRIKLHDRDVRILTYIQNTLHMGRIRANKNKPHSIWIVSTKQEMLFLINKLSGLIRLKVDSFKKSCEYLNVDSV